MGRRPRGDRQPALIRRDFTLDRPIACARLYVTAHGLYETEINGRRVGDEALAPGWTVYPHRLRYRTHDVTDHLTEGANTIGAWLGDGWYRGKYGFDGGTRNIYGTDQSLIAQLEVTYDDGTTTVIATDDTWRAAPGPIVTSGLYEGETFDARLHHASWSTPAGAHTGTWSPVRTGERDPRTLVAPLGPRSLAPRSSPRSPSPRPPTAATSSTSGRTWSAAYV